MSEITIEGVDLMKFLTTNGPTSEAKFSVEDFYEAAEKIRTDPRQAPVYIHHSRCAAVASQDRRDCNCAVMGRG